MNFEQEFKCLEISSSSITYRQTYHVYFLLLRIQTELDLKGFPYHLTVWRLLSRSFLGALSTLGWSTPACVEWAGDAGSVCILSVYFFPPP